jgi:catechol 2,3-dioxygenase-like lactoylglutathione lyase family enzyme
MTIILNHTITPSRDKVQTASLFASIFGLKVTKADRFEAVRFNDQLTLLFDNLDAFEPHHYAFHVNDAEFDAILNRVKEAGLAFGSGPRSPDDGQLNNWNDGRGFYFKTPDGHLLELMTVPQ